MTTGIWTAMLDISFNGYFLDYCSWYFHRHVLVQFYLLLLILLMILQRIE